MRTEQFENFDRDCDTLAKSTQHGRDRVPRSEPRISRQPTEQTSKLVLNSVRLENVGDDREKAVERNPNAVRQSSTRASLKCNTDDVVNLWRLLVLLVYAFHLCFSCSPSSTRCPSTWTMVRSKRTARGFIKRASRPPFYGVPLAGQTTSFRLSGKRFRKTRVAR